MWWRNRHDWRLRLLLRNYDGLRGCRNWLLRPWLLDDWLLHQRLLHRWLNGDLRCRSGRRHWRCLWLCSLGFTFAFLASAFHFHFDSLQFLLAIIIGNGFALLLGG